MEDGNIRDSQLTSSTFNGDDRAEHGRLNRPSDQYAQQQGITRSTGSFGGWCAEEDDTDKWLQVDLGSPKSIAGIIMQGRGNIDSSAHWVSEYRVAFSYDSISWQYVLDDTQQVEMVCIIQFTHIFRSFNWLVCTT